ncbi:MAG: CPBP family intramembrane glutamic endopeptidase [Gemmatimonadaceae bacterium]
MNVRRAPGLHSLSVFFVLAWAISWLIWSPLWLPRFGISVLPVLPFHHALGALGPITAAFIVSAIESGSAGPAKLFAAMGVRRDQAMWVVIALVGPLLILILAVVGASLFNARPFSLTGFGLPNEFPQFSALGFLFYNILTFGFGEETGWRGFALPRLQARHSALVSSLLLTAGWAIWHVPLFLYRPGYVSMGIAGIGGWLFSLVTGSVLLTWMFNQSRGSILVVALFHAAIDVAFTSSLTSPFIVSASGALITLWGIAVVLIAGPLYLSRDGKIVQSRDAAGEFSFMGPDKAQSVHS